MTAKEKIMQSRLDAQDEEIVILGSIEALGSTDIIENEFYVPSMVRNRDNVQ